MARNFFFFGRGSLFCRKYEKKKEGVCRKMNRKRGREPRPQQEEAAARRKRNGQEMELTLRGLQKQENIEVGNSYGQNKEENPRMEPRESQLCTFREYELVELAEGLIHGGVGGD